MNNGNKRVFRQSATKTAGTTLRRSVVLVMTLPSVPAVGRSERRIVRSEERDGPVLLEQVAGFGAEIGEPSETVQREPGGVWLVLVVAVVRLEERCESLADLASGDVARLLGIGLSRVVMVATAVVMVLERGVDNLKDGVFSEINYGRRQRMTRQVRTRERETVGGNSCIVIVGGEAKGVLNQVLRAVDGVLERVLDGMLDSLEVVDREILEAMRSGFGDLIK